MSNSGKLITVESDPDVWKILQVTCSPLWSSCRWLSCSTTSCPTPAPATLCLVSWLMRTWLSWTPLEVMASKLLLMKILQEPGLLILHGMISSSRPAWPSTLSLLTVGLLVRHHCNIQAQVQADPEDHHRKWWKFWWRHFFWPHFLHPFLPQLWGKVSSSKHLPTVWGFPASETGSFSSLSLYICKAETVTT